MDRRITERFVLSDVAIVDARRVMNDRLNSMNEFRDALRDQANRMATRTEVEKIDEVIPRLATRAELNGIDQAVRELQRAKANLDGRLLMVSGTISVIVSIALWLLNRLVK